MVTQVEGFISEDGTFFRDAAEARAHEALFRLRVSLEQANMKNIDSALSFIASFRIEIMDYLNAIADMDTKEDTTNTEEAQYEIDANSFGEGQDDNHISETIDGEPEEEAQSVQPLPPGVRKPVPDLGRHIQPTQVRHERPVNGPRSGGKNASGVRKR